MTVHVGTMVISQRLQYCNVSMSCNTHTHIYTHTLTHIHTSHTCTHTVHSHTYTHHTHAHKHTCTHTHAHTCTHMHTRAHTCTHLVSLWQWALLAACIVYVIISLESSCISSGSELFSREVLDDAAVVVRECVCTHV